MQVWLSSKHNLLAASTAPVLFPSPSPPPPPLSLSLSLSLSLPLSLPLSLSLPLLSLCHSPSLFVSLSLPHPLPPPLPPFALSVWCSLPWSTRGEVLGTPPPPQWFPAPPCSPSPPPNSSRRSYPHLGPELYMNILNQYSHRGAWVCSRGQCKQNPCFSNSEESYTGISNPSLSIL